jgi:hypothetical protein
MHAFLNKLLGPPEEINGAGRCPTYLYRWPLFRFAWGKWGKIYLHHFVGDDWSLDLHDHPKRFISIGLWGGYWEYTPSRFPELFTAPWIRSFPAEHIHRIAMRIDRKGKRKSCWTVCIVLKPTREWGFWHLGQFIHWRDYVRGKDGVADRMKACE